MPKPAPPRRGFDPLAYRDPRPSPALIHALGLLNRHLLLRRVLRLRAIDLPRADLERLRAAVRPGTAAFLAPVHPEFMTDWLIDKEISRLVSPLMAHWASYEIVNAGRLARAFWLRNNLIANTPGGGGKEYSVRWALAGHGVLLHPEGVTRWQGDRVQRLLPGIVDLAWEACRRVSQAGAGTPVFIVPIVWKLHFTGDVSAGLAREMGLIERRLALPPGAGLPLEQRFAALQESLLLRLCERLGPSSPHPGPGRMGRHYFDIQRTVVGVLLSRLQERYGACDDDVERLAHRVRRALRKRAAAAEPAGGGGDRALLVELERLSRFDPEIYDTPTLTQEAIAENLKRARSTLLTGHLADTLQNLVPVAVAPRVARIRVPEPIAVDEAFAAAAGPAERKGALLESLHERMQRTLDALNAEIAPVVDPWRRPNPLWSGAAD